MEEILSLLKDDTKSLGEATLLENELANLTLKVIKLGHDRENREHKTMGKG